MSHTGTPASTHSGAIAGSTAELPALTHDFANRLPELTLDWKSAEAQEPGLLALSVPLAEELGLDPEFLRSEAGLRFLLGQDLPDEARPVAQLYAGHQFGAYVPQLGDGRAMLLGELQGPAGRMVDVHLKGSGRTPFARADGFAAAGPMLREFLMGEAMHALGVPTTRGLAVISTGRWVQREELHPGAVLVRTAQSHLRVGSFQFAVGRGDLGLLRRLTDYAVERHSPALAQSTEAGSPERAIGLLRDVVSRHAQLTAHWMLLGFVHGVMNTDNVTISGETIDYGPCAFLDAYDPTAVFSSIDHAGRYAYGNQPAITQWNLTRFAETLLPVISGAEDLDNAVTEESIGEAREVLEEFAPAYDAAWTAGMRAKLGLDESASDAAVTQLSAAILTDLQSRRLDYTSFFRALTRAARGDASRLRGLCPPGDDAWPGEWFNTWQSFDPDGEQMARVNPVYIPRNHLTDQALDAAEGGDMDPFRRLLEAVTLPYDERPHFEEYEDPAPPELGQHRTFCGT